MLLNKEAFVFILHNIVFLTLQGKNLNLGFNTSDIIVKIGKGFCKVTSIDKHGNQLNCKPPKEQPASAHGNQYPEIVVSCLSLVSDLA